MTAQQQKQVNNETIKKCRRSFQLSLMLVLGLALVKLVLANRAASWGREVEQIQKEAELVQSGNEQLKLELNRRLGGLDKVKEQAISLGFSDKTQYLYLTSGESVAQSRP